MDDTFKDDEVIHWIHAAGGVAVLAHPFRYRMTRTKLKRLLSDLVAADCNGIEVVTGNNNTEEISLANQYLDEFNLLASVGSDYHGWQNQHTQLGVLKNLPNPDKAIWQRW